MATKKVSTLQQLYLKATTAQARHFKKEWLQYFGLSLQSWHNRMEKPTIEDLALWYYINGGNISDSPFLELINAYNDAFFVGGVTKWQVVQEKAMAINANGL